MSAAEEQGRGGGGFGESFGEIDAGDFGGDGVVGPAFFDQRNEQRAGFFRAFKSKGMKRLRVGAGVDRSGGGEHENVAGGGWRRGRLWCRVR